MQNETATDLLDVLIIGAGPVGTAMANLCGRLNLRTLLVDRLADIQQDPRAISLDNEALRVLQNVGLTDNAFEKEVIRQVTLRSPQFGLFARMDTDKMVDTHPMVVTFFQPDLERALHRSLSQWSNVEILRSVECRGVTQHQHTCDVDLRSADGREFTVSSRFVVAADGARSSIRRQLGLSFGGSTYEEDWLIVDALNVAEPIQHVDFFCDPRRPSPQMPAPGNRQRWEFMLRRGEDPEQLLCADNIRQLLAERGIEDDPVIERKAVYRFHARVAEKFRVGRIYLVGDAAHVTPPFAGQGLVAGLRDVFNLAWKLKQLIENSSGQLLMDSYDTERRPHAWEMIQLAQWMGRMIMPRNTLAALLSQGTARLMMLTPLFRRKLMNLENKPKNRFHKGLFVANPSWFKRLLSGEMSRGYRNGDHLPQGWLQPLQQGQESASAEERQRSDDVLGLTFQLVGIDCDPLTVLTKEQRLLWERLGGSFLTIATHPEIELGGAWLDCEGVFSAKSQGEPWLVMVRPDKVVMANGPANQLPLLLARVEALLTSDPVS